MVNARSWPLEVGALQDRTVYHTEAHEELLTKALFCTVVDAAVAKVATGEAMSICGGTYGKGVGMWKRHTVEPGQWTACAAIFFVDYRSCSAIVWKLHFSG